MKKRELRKIKKALKNWKPKLTPQEKYLFARMIASQELSKLYHEAYGKDMIIGGPVSQFLNPPPA